jgi:hypothetical protein
MILRLSLILIFISGFAYAKSDTCYSVQLASYMSKNQDYINSVQYPKECKQLSFANAKAIRCGCFDTKEAAKLELQRLKKRYIRPIIVRTYRARFERIKSKADLEKTTQEEPKTEDALFYADKGKKAQEEKHLPQSKTGFTTQETESFSSTNEDADYHGFEDIPTKLKIQYFFYESELGVQGHLDLTTQGYLQRPSSKHKANMTGSGEIEFDFKKDELTVFAKIYAQADYHDALSDDEQNDRSYIRFDELYTTYDFEDSQIMLGKSVRFWGALEAENITDVFNPDDLRSDPFDTRKLGVWNTAYTYYTDSGELALIAKFYEQDRRMANDPYVYYVYGDTLDNLSIPLGYNKNLETEKSSSRPSIFLKYSGTADTEYAWDYAFIFENGYDSQRYFNVTPDTLPIPSSVEFQENAYIVNKLITYNTVVIGSTLLKVEAMYANIDSNPTMKSLTLAGQEFKKISDYYHIGLGLEHTLTQFYGEADLGLIAEYYKYDTIDDGEGYADDIDLFQVMQNDLFLGLRYSFNEGNDASIVGGGIFDMDYHEQVYYIEYEGRIADTFKLNLDYRYIKPSSSTPTAFNLMERHQRLSLKMGYYF